MLSNRPKALTTEQIASRLPALKGWSLAGAALHRDFKFEDFKAAWGFMSKVALMAEKLDHHPMWSNEYNSVSISLSTHDAGGITQLDFDLATQIDRL